MASKRQLRSKLFINFSIHGYSTIYYAPSKRAILDRVKLNAKHLFYIPDDFEYDGARLVLNGVSSPDPDTYALCELTLTHPDLGLLRGRSASLHVANYFSNYNLYK